MIIIKGKKIRWIILGVCLILFTTIMIFVITKNKLYIDDIGSNNMDKIVKIITNIGGTIVIGIVTIISLFIFRNKKINICIVLNLLGIVVLNNVIIKNILVEIDLVILILLLRLVRVFLLDIVLLVW